MGYLKKFWAGVLALALLSSCGGTAGTTSPPAAPSPTATVQPPSVDTLRLTREEFPVLNGSTSTAPLARAVCSVLLGESLDQVHDLVNFSKTTASYRALMQGNADLLIAAEPADTVVAEREEAGFRWEATPIATDALVFLVNERNPVDRLTTRQVQQIYTGEITNWSEVGGEDREILPFQRNDEAGSQTLMKKLVMDGLPLMEAPKDYTVSSMEGLIEAVRSFDGSPGAIGYTVYYYANDMNMADGLKVVAIDDALPNAVTIRSGAYPFTNPYYAVIAADAPADSPARQVFDWLQGPVGQSLIAHEGYVSILADPAPVEWDLGETQPVQEVYTRLSPDPLPSLTPRAGGYGGLLPYIGGSMPGQWWDDERYGLVTRDGKIVVDPVYDGVWQLRGYNPGDDLPVRLPVYALCQTLPVGEQGAYEQRYALCALDGSWATGFDYLYAGFADEAHIWAVAANGDGVMLDARAKELWRLPLPPGEELWYYQGGMADRIYWLDGVGLHQTGLEQEIVRVDGTVVSGKDKSWADILGFSEGLGMARDPSSRSSRYVSGERWGYVDTDGSWAIPPDYASVGDFRNGKAVVRRADETILVIDKTGKVLWESGQGEISLMEGEGFSYYYHYLPTSDEGSQYKVLACYDEDLSEISFGATGRDVAWSQDGWLAERVPEGVRLYSPLGVRYIRAQGNLEAVKSGLAVFRTGESWDDPNIFWSVYQLDGTELLPPGQWDRVGFITDEETGRDYLYTREGGRSDIYDLKGRFLLSASTYPTISGGLVVSRSELSYGFQTLDGTWVFRISLMKSQGD